MNDIDEEIRLLNEIIETATSHGAGIGGEFDSGKELKEIMEAYLAYRGLSDEYVVDNPDWVKSTLGYNGFKIDTYLCFRKI